LACALVFFSVFGFYYIKYQHIVDERLKQPIFANTAKIYAAPREVRPGQKLTVQLIANELREAGYSADGASQTSQMGTLQRGRADHHRAPRPAVLSRAGRRNHPRQRRRGESITDDHGQPLSSYELEPLLITGLSDDANRTKRRLLTYDEIPPTWCRRCWPSRTAASLSTAASTTAASAGQWHDVFRAASIAGRLHADHATGARLLRRRRRSASSANDRDRHHLPARTPLQQAADLRDVRQPDPLGQRGSFSIDGFGEASQAYFGKDVRQLDLAECALLAGIIQRPSYFNPFRHPDRTIERRNLVLDSMVETGAITKDQAERAKAEPLHLFPQQRGRQRGALLCRPGA
jgi:penicillin-binding protein 1B